MSRATTAGLSATTDPGGGGDDWRPVCELAHLEPGRGVAALLGGRPVAIFRLDTGTDAITEVVAIANVDPWAGASVLARGLTGRTTGPDGTVDYVASPLRKQRLDLRTGQALDDAEVAVATWPTRVVDGRVEVRFEDDGHRAETGPTSTARTLTGCRWDR